MKEFELRKAYQSDSALRHSFNQLAEQIFGLDFEDWYQNGYWGENYIPYSIVANGEVVANVSVNRMVFFKGEEKKHFIQLGTVMTREGHRNQGLIRRLMEEIEKDYGEKTEGMYLFANDSVLSFYPKFGYKKENEYQYSKKVHLCGERTALQVLMKEKRDWDKLEQAIRKSVRHSRFEMIDNIQLIMFYVTKFMQENVYYIKELDAWVIAEIEGENLFIHAVYYNALTDKDSTVNDNIGILKHTVLDSVIEAFGKEIHTVTLGFSPIDKEGYTVSEIHEDDTTLFIKGKGLTGLNKHKFMFPTLSHA